MTALTGKELEKRLDHPLFGDAYLTGLAATAAVFALAGWGVGWGLLLGLVAGIAGVFVIAVACGVMTGDDPVALKGRLLGSASYALLIGWLGWTSAGVGGLAVAALVFAYLAVQVVRRHRALPPGTVVLPDPGKTPALPEHASIPGPIGLAYAQLPADLGVDLRARVDAALENYRQLHEILHDPLLLTHITVDAPGMLAAAEEIALDLLRQVPRLARIQTLAARRGHDEAARAAASAAFASLDKHAEALHQAASAAFKIVAAGPDSDTQNLREHTDRLQGLRAVHDELQTH
jgi:hypothetical protein